MIFLLYWPFLEMLIKLHRLNYIFCQIFDHVKLFEISISRVPTNDGKIVRNNVRKKIKIVRNIILALSLLKFNKLTTHISIVLEIFLINKTFYRHWMILRKQMTVQIIMNSMSISIVWIILEKGKTTINQKSHLELNSYIIISSS